MNFKFRLPQWLYIPAWFNKNSWIPDEPDSRDLLYSENAGLFQATIDANGGVVSLRKYCSPVDTQKHHGACAANTVVNGIELRRIQAGLEHIDYSRFFIYYNSRLAHNAIGQDKGTKIRYALASTNSIGVCRSVVWPYILENVNKRPAWKAYKEAYKTKISGYYRIDGDYNEINSQIEHSLRSGHPVAFGTKVYSDFCDGKLKPGNIARIPSKGENFKARHAMLIVGYDSKRRLFEVKNSWGSWWGENGYFWMPYEYLKMADASDFWVMTMNF